MAGVIEPASDPIPGDVRGEIESHLARAEAEHRVRNLFAIESGSRAWGFASPNSDFDARFIFSRSADWYLAVDLEERRDVIEYPIVDDIDLNGWDLRKALRLFWKSNPAFVEWIQSPITYLDRGNFRRRALELLPSVYSPEKGIHHYRAMALNNYRAYLRQESVVAKKYFYALRPLLAARWIERYREAPPIEFERLLELVDDPAVLAAVNALLELKRGSPELGQTPMIPALNTFIAAFLEEGPPDRTRNLGSTERVAVLNELFQETLRESG
jgi:predicted nucleotidyltransferase